VTFYDEMASMATELLTEFGQEIVLTRPSLNFSNITNKPISGGKTNLTTICVLTNRDRSLVDGTRIQDTDRVMVIDASVSPRMGDLLDVSGMVTTESVGAAPGIILSPGQALSWTIVAIKDVNPAGTPICYFVQVRR